MRPARRLHLARLLPVLACPECQGLLSLRRSAITCANGHRYSVTPLGIPLFAPPSLGLPAEEESREEDEAAAYAAMRAFAAGTLRRGEAEGLYRTISDLLLRALAGERPRWLLDIGCGSGRTLVDAATAFPRAYAIGIDQSTGALTIAYGVTRLAGRAVEVDLRRWGFGYQAIESWQLKNVFLVQAAAGRLPFAQCGTWPGFDAVTCVNLMDRIREPEEVLSETARVLRPGGRLVLATPLNWRQSDGRYWPALSDLDALCAAVAGLGFEIDEAFDGLVYREILDARGSVTDWRVAVVSAQRSLSGICRQAGQSDRAPGEHRVQRIQGPGSSQSTLL